MKKSDMSDYNLVKRGVNFTIKDEQLALLEKVRDALTSPDDNKNIGDASKSLSLASAPKGKPKAPPLIHEKVKPDAVASERVHRRTEPSSEHASSQIPLKKTKSSSSEFKNELGSNKPFGAQKKESSTGSRSARSKDSDQSKTSSNGRSVERVKIAKGIEMKRVVQDAGQVKSRLVKTITPRTNSNLTTTAKLDAESSSKMSTSSSRKMTKATLECAADVKVKSFLPEHRSLAAASTSKSSVGNKSKLPGAKNSPTDVKNESEKVEKEGEELELNANAGATLDEFLNMPETNIPEPEPKKENGPTKEKLFKSKYWEYLNTKPEKQVKKEQKKPYDPDEVKSFMLKQREQRKVLQLKKSKEKQEEQEKRQRMLKELESKYARPRGRTSGSDHNLPGARSSRPLENASTSPPKLTNLESESPSLKYLKPLLERKLEPGFLKKSEGNLETAAKQAQYLISEFEAIVKRECIGILKQIPSCPLDPVEKVDKAVWTSASICDLNSTKSSLSDASKFNIPGPHQVESAAIKIQAAYKGYKVRKALKETDIDVRKLNNKVWESSSYQNRRWSLPAPSYPLPEKPFTAPAGGKVLPMSPIPISSFNPSAVPSYIPPPSGMSQPHRNLSKPRVLPNIALTPVRLRIYDEPYPKISQTPTTSGITPSRDQPKGKRNTDQWSSQNFSLSRTIENFQLPQSSLGKPQLHVDFSVPSSLPSVLDAFREKLNHFKTQLESVPSSVDLERSSGHRSEGQKKEEETGTYTTEFETVSSSDVKSTVSTIADEITETPKIRKRKHHRSRSKSSATTIVDETEEEYASAASKRRSADDQGYDIHSDSSGSILHPTSSNSLGRLYAPSLKLRYEAERERIKVIEKALQVKLTSSTNLKTNEKEQKTSFKAPQHLSSKGIEVGSSITEERSKDKINTSESVQYAIAKVQKESLRAAAEMAKWMAEFQKTTTENKVLGEKVACLDLPALVHAAVEEALRLGEVKKKGQTTEKQKKIKGHSPRSSSARSSSEVAEISKRHTTTSSEPPPLNKKVAQPAIEELRRSDIRDYQQQFPSDSSRSSSALKLERIVGLAAKSPECGSSVAGENFEASSIEYPSIIPSGNSVEITSIDHKVSSLANGSSISAAVDLDRSESGKFEVEAADATDSEIISEQSDTEKSIKESEAENLSPKIVSEEDESKKQLDSTIQKEESQTQERQELEMSTINEQFTESQPKSEASTINEQFKESQPKSEASTINEQFTESFIDENEAATTNSVEKEIINESISRSFIDVPDDEASQGEEIKIVEERSNKEEAFAEEQSEVVIDIHDSGSSVGETEVEQLSPNIISDIEEEEESEARSGIGEEPMVEISSILEQFSESSVIKNEDEDVKDSVIVSERVSPSFADLVVNAINNSREGEEDDDYDEFLEEPTFEKEEEEIDSEADEVPIEQEIHGDQIDVVQSLGETVVFQISPEEEESKKEPVSREVTKDEKSKTEVIEEAFSEDTAGNEEIKEQISLSFVSEENDNQNEDEHRLMISERESEQKEEKRMLSEPKKRVQEEPKSEISSVMEEFTESFIEENEAVTSSIVEKKTVIDDEKETLKSGEEPALEHDEKGALESDEKGALESDEKGALEPNEKDALESDEKDALKSDEKATLESDERVALEHDEKVALESDEKVALESNEKVALEHDEKGVLGSDDEPALESDEKVALESNEKVALESNEKVALESNEKVALEHDEKVILDLGKVPLVSEISLEPCSPSDETKSETSKILEECSESFITENDAVSRSKDTEEINEQQQILFPGAVEFPHEDDAGEKEKEDSKVSEPSSVEAERNSKSVENENKQVSLEESDAEVSIEEDPVDESGKGSVEVKEEECVVVPTEPSLGKEVPVFVSKPHNSLLIPEAERIPQEPEVPLKPPPPYSPSSSLDSTSLSSRSLMICLTKPKVERIVEEQVNKIWPLWTSLNSSIARQMPPLSLVLESKQLSTEEYTQPASNEPSSSIGNVESLTNAIENFDLLLWHLVYETIKETLLGANNSTSFIERVRPGPLALQAQAMKTPRSKEALIKDVVAKVMKTIPPTFFRESDHDFRSKSKKWCSRPRELVDEILLEELEKENYQWTEWWPEEKIVIHNATNNIIRGLIRNALEKRNYVYEQGWPKCLNFKYDVVRI